MAIDKVVLVNTTSDNQINVEDAQHCYTLKVLEEALNTSGFSNVSLYPDRDLDGNFGSEEFYEGLVGELEKIVGDSKNVVFGFSVLTDRYYFARAFAGFVRRRFHNAKIVIGGKHVDNEEITLKSGQMGGRKIMSSAEIALRENIEGMQIFDAAFVGDCDSFVTYVKTEGVLDESIKGLYFLRDDILVGKGRGAYPNLNNVPVSFEVMKNTNIMYLLLNSSCPNRCDYCPPDRIRPVPDIEKAVAAVKSLAPAKTLVSLEMLDPSPFTECNINYYIDLFNILRYRERIGILPGSYLDAHILTNPDYKHFLFKFFKQFMFKGFFIGRDCVDAEVAQKIGRRYHETSDACRQMNRTRTQHDLDNEAEAITDLIRFLKSEEYPLTSRVSVSYILSPFDTYQTTSRMIAEAQDYSSMSGTKVGVTTPFWMLTPYPGTKLRRQYAHLMVNPEEFHTQSVYANCWSYDLGPQVYFMDKALELRIKEGQDPKTYFNDLRKALDDAYAGRLRQMPERERRFIP